MGKKVRILTPEEKIAKKERAIAKERRPKTVKTQKQPRKYDPWRDDFLNFF